MSNNEKLSEEQLKTVVGGSEENHGKVYAIDEEKCINCWECRPVCPTEAVLEGQFFCSIDASLCTGCGMCSGVCPTNAIHYR